MLLGRIYDLWNGFMSTYKLTDLNTAVPRTDDGCWVVCDSTYWILWHMLAISSWNHLRSLRNYVVKPINIS